MGITTLLHTYTKDISKPCRFPEGVFALNPGVMSSIRGIEVMPSHYIITLSVSTKARADLISSAPSVLFHLDSQSKRKHIQPRQEADPPAALVTRGLSNNPGNIFTKKIQSRRSCLPKGGKVLHIAHRWLHSSRPRDVHIKTYTSA